MNGGASPAIAVREATKVYRRTTRRPHGTLKSAFLSRTPGNDSRAARRRDDGDGIRALDRVSFELASGGTLGVIGANGSGKSTLLRLLAGIMRPTSGSVSVAGRVAALLELGAGFHPEISGRENIEITGLLLGLTRAQIARRFSDIVDFAGVAEFLDAPVKTYSSGMAVRLGFAIAAHSEPDVLLVDEVLAVGDEEFSHRALEKFSEFERDGRTLVFVSHDLNLVAERCRRVLWLENGRLAADAGADEVVARYRESVAVGEGERRRDAPVGGSRIGSGAASIESVRVLDGGGRAVGRLSAGEPGSLEMTVRAPQPLADFVFGFQIATVSGAVVLGTNTALDGFRGGTLEGEARVTLAIPAWDLAPGVYSVDAAVHARDGAPYDYRRDVLRFEVTSQRAGGGIWSPTREWRFEGGATVAPVTAWRRDA